MQPLSLDAFGEPLHSFPAFTASVCNLNPTSRGHVRIRSRDRGDAPAIAPNYLSTDEDRKIAADSIRQIRKIDRQPAGARHNTNRIEWKPGIEFQSDGESGETRRRYRQHHLSPRRHRRGWGVKDDPMAVVDSRLRVRGIAGLRVVDAERDADHYQRQHQRADNDDRGESRALDHRRRTKAGVVRNVRPMPALMTARTSQPATPGNDEARCR
ncbi:GMC oxidoreductase [Ensifer canadensis]